MKKMILAFFVVTLVFGLVMTVGTDEAAAMSSFKEVPAAPQANCTTCHDGMDVKVPDHSGRDGKTCETCHTASKPEPAPEPAKEEKSAPVPAANAEPTPAKPAAPSIVKRNMDFAVTGVVGSSKYTATNNFEVRIYQNHAYIKVRELANLAGDYLQVADLTWDNNEKAVSFNSLKNKLVLHTKKAAFEINGVEIVTDRGAKIINNQVYVPIRSFVEALGGSVHYSEAEGISISVPNF